MSVYKAIAAVMADLSKEGISKGRKNQQQGYAFRGIDDVYNALAPVLSAHGLVCLPRVLSREVVERQTKAGGAIFYVTVAVEFDLVSADDGTFHTVKTYGEAMDTADKATNKAMSAAYKYMAMEVFCIPTEGDNDADSKTYEIQPKSAKSVPADELSKQDADTRIWLEDIASNVRQLITRKDVKGAYDEVESHNLAIEHKAALWALLDSKERSAIKAESELRKEAK